MSRREALAIATSCIDRIANGSPSQLLSSDPNLLRFFCESFLRRFSPPVVAVVSRKLSTSSSSSPSAEHSTTVHVVHDQQRFPGDGLGPTPSFVDVTLELPEDLGPRCAVTPVALLPSSARVVAIASAAARRRVSPEHAPELLVWDALSGGPPAVRRPLPELGGAASACHAANERWVAACAGEGDLFAWPLDGATPGARFSLPVAGRSLCFAGADPLWGSRLSVLGARQDLLGPLFSTHSVSVDAASGEVSVRTAGAALSKESPILVLLSDGLMLVERPHSGIELVAADSLQTIRLWDRMPFWSSVLRTHGSSALNPSTLFFGTMASGDVGFVWSTDSDQPVLRFEAVHAMAIRDNVAFVLSPSGRLSAFDIDAGGPPIWAVDTGWSSQAFSVVLS